MSVMTSAGRCAAIALSASLQPYAGFEEDELCEYPAEPSLLAQELTARKLLPDASGRLCLSEQPGLGIQPDLNAMQKYLVEVEIKVAGKVVFSSLASKLKIGN